MTTNDLETSSSFAEHFSGSFGHSYLSSSAGKTATSQNKSTGLKLGELTELSNNRVSAFLPFDEIITNDQVGAKNEIVSRIFTEVREVQEGKVDNLLRVMSFHPEFLQEFINLYNYLMYSQHGALPYDWRHFIGIMGAARHKCIYLVKQQEREFLNQNGQNNWLKHGINYIPQKLRDLNELNKLLCHQPWLINHTHLEKILKGPFSWTVTELTMAITILTLFHSLSGFVFGCGINENYTQELRRQFEREEEEMQRRRQRAARMAAAKLSSSSNKSRNKRGKRDPSDDNVSRKPPRATNLDDLSDDYNDEEDNVDADDDDDECNDDEVDLDADEDDNDENLDLAGGELGASAARMHARTSRANFRNSSGSSGDMGYGFSRARSNSTGASNRTLSNSSASSCEVGIDLLLKEMQMINQKSEDKQNQSNKSTTSSAILSSSLIMQRIIRSTSPNSCTTTTSTSSTTTSGYLGSGCLSPPAAYSSGPSTITNNSPTTQTNGSQATTSSTPTIYYSYLSDLSNTASINGSTGAGPLTGSRNHCHHHNFVSHDNNNNSIHHSSYHSYNQYHNGSVGSQKTSSDLADGGPGSDADETTTSPSVKTRVVKFDAKSVDDLEHSSHHNNYLNHEPVSHTVINQKIRDYMLKYAIDLEFGYQDLESSADPSLRLEYMYTWDNQGYFTTNSIYPDICEFLDKNFKVAANMTYNTMGNVKGVDTSLFRKAVWFYTHSLFGVKYDDYDYSQIRILLKSPLRKYIKTVCTQPERITKVHYDSIMKEFAHSEKVHMNLVIMEARIQASMLYFLRAVNSYYLL